MKVPLLPYLVLISMGAAWGLSIPLTKITVSTGYGQFGLIFWQFVLAAILLGLVSIARRKRPLFERKTLFLFTVLALVGTIFPNSASYVATYYLPASFIAILIATVPMFSFPIAMIMGLEKIALRRISGIVIGFLGVFVLTAPEASFPDRHLIIFIPLALLAPFFYAIEGNYVDKYGTAGQDPIQTFTGASILGTFLILPVTISTGQWIDPFQPWPLQNYTHLGSSLCHAFAYCAYVWLVSRSGAVFTAQTAYFVTAWGVLWSIFILDEEMSQYLWGSIFIMFIGMFLVLPKNYNIESTDSIKAHD